jgi:F-type H+-transporting ATPase subunit delta
MRSVIAQRYAKALFALAKTGSMQEGWGRQLKQLGDLIETEEFLRNMLLHPDIEVSRKGAVLNRLGVLLHTAEPVQRLLNILVQRHRVQDLGSIAIAFRELVDRTQGRQPVQAQTAYSLSDSEAKRLKDQLEGVLEKQVELHWEVNPNLLGGIVFQLGSLRYDGSIRGQLERFRTAVLAGS